MADNVHEIVVKLAERGKSHFHSSYVAGQAGISVDEAQARLEAMRKDKTIDVHFEVICPNCDRTIKSFEYGDKVPLGEWIEDDDCGVEPFELRESDLLITYSPGRDLLLSLNKSAPQDSKKKKSNRWSRARSTISSALHRSTASDRNQRSLHSSSTTASTQRKLRKHRPVGQQ